MNNELIYRVALSVILVAYAVVRLYYAYSQAELNTGFLKRRLSRRIVLLETSTI